VPSAIGPVKEMLLSLDRGKLWSDLKPMLSGSKRSLRQELADWAADHRVVV
jgi:phosphotransferase system enzyme I (PtsP)